MNISIIIRNIIAFLLVAIISFFAMDVLLSVHEYEQDHHDQYIRSVVQQSKGGI